MYNLSQIAIEAALSQNWEKAEELNESILRQNNQDIEALIRLAYANVRLGKIGQAKKIYRKILKIDKYNLLAQKNLDKIKTLTQLNTKQQLIHREKVDPSLYIEEPGKTKSINLINLAPVSILSKISIGDLVVLHPKKHSIEVRLTDKTYIGALPDDIAFRLLKFISYGNSYIALIKNIQKNILTVFLKEVARSKKLKNQPTFAATSKEYTASTPREIKKSVLGEENQHDREDHEEVEE